jgi:hypothetical protein
LYGDERKEGPVGVAEELLELIPVGAEVTTYSVSRLTGIEHPLVRSRMGWLVRKGKIEYVRDEPCDPSLGSYEVGVYRRSR